MPDDTIRVTLADTLIERLNWLIANPEVRDDIHRLIEERVVCSNATLEHPTIQASGPDRTGLCECEAYGGPGCSLCKPQFGFLGLLNGIVGTIGGHGPRKSWGLITAVIGDDGKLQRFERTAEEPTPWTMI
jgi:hypothetical protein